MGLSQKGLLYIQTVLMVFTWVNMGFNLILVYSVLPDLLTRTNSTVEQMSVAFSFGNVGGLIVPFFAVFLDKFIAYEEGIIGFLLFFGAAAVTLKGIATSVWQVAIYNFTEALTWGAINAIGQSAILRQWGDGAGSAMQALHLGFPIGAILAPFIAVPFVSDTETDSSTDTNTTFSMYSDRSISIKVPDSSDIGYSIELEGAENGDASCLANIGPYGYVYGTNAQHLRSSLSAYSNDDIMNQHESEIATYAEFRDDSSIGILMGIAGLFTIIIASCHLVLQCVTKAHTKTDNKNEKVDTEKPSLKQVLSFDSWAYGHGKYGIAVMTLTTLFFVLHVASTLGIMTYLVTYAVNDSGLGFSNEEGAWLQMAVSISAAFGRGSCIFIAKYVSLNMMIFFELHGQLIMAVLILIFGTQSATALWVTSCLYGFFREPTWPSGMTWPNQFIIMLVFLVAIMQIFTSLFGIPLQLLQGYLYTNISPETIFHTTIVFGICNCVVFYFMLLLERVNPNKPSLQQLVEENGETVKEDIKNYVAVDNNGYVNDSVACTSTYL